MIVTNSSLIPRPETIIGWAPILGLTDTAALAALDVSSLGDGFILGVAIGDNLGWWKLRPLANGEVGEPNGLLICNGNGARCWIRIL